MTMLTGGIDLSVGTVATMAAFIVATQGVDNPAGGRDRDRADARRLLIGFANGIGVGVFRVHPLIMTLGTSLIGVGCLQVYQRTVIAVGHQGAGLPDLAGHRRSPGAFPNALLLFIPVAALLSSSSSGRVSAGCSTRSATTSTRRGLPASNTGRSSLALYMLSSVLAGIMGLLYMGLIKAPSLSLAEPLVLPSVAAAVIGGTSIFGGRGGYTGTIVGALILTVLTTLLTILQMPEGARRILFGAIILLVTAAYLRIIEDR